MEAHEPPAGGRSTRRYQRGTDEFTRVLAFSDAVFAIAMTLLVVGIEVPELSETDSVDELAGALNDDLPSFISFVISFLVIGRYWVAHHSFINRLAAIDARLIGINLIYLLFIACDPRRVLRDPAVLEPRAHQHRLAAACGSADENHAVGRGRRQLLEQRLATHETPVAGRPSHPCERDPAAVPIAIHRRPVSPSSAVGATVGRDGVRGGPIDWVLRTGRDCAA